MDDAKIPGPKVAKSSREIFSDYVGEVIGFEKGFYKTIVDLRKQPRVVVESYLAKEGIYASPFKVLITAVSFWLLLNNFIIDWYNVWGGYMTTISNYMWFEIDGNTKPIPDLMLTTNAFLTKLAGDFFSKYYMAMVVLITPTWAFICYKFCRSFKIDYRTHFAVVGYHFSLGFFPALIYMCCLAINFWFCIAVITLIAISPLIGLRSIYNKLLAVVPVARFFEGVPNAVVIEMKYFRARLLVTFLALFVYASLCWIVYR